MAYKSKSITSKASSAVKINMGLIQGTRDLAASKTFTNYQKLVEPHFTDEKKVDHSAPKEETSKPPEKQEAASTENNSQSKAVTTEAAKEVTPKTTKPVETPKTTSEPVIPTGK